MVGSLWPKGDLPIFFLSWDVTFLYSIRWIKISRCCICCRNNYSEIYFVLNIYLINLINLICFNLISESYTSFLQPLK